jgi:hypothetical protein
MHALKCIVQTIPNGVAMKLVSLASLFLVFASTAHAQVTIQSKPIAHYTECINAAIAGTSLEKSGESIQFSCYGEVAKSFFAYLATKQTFDLKSGGATYRARFMNNKQVTGQDFCWQQLETADAQPTGSKFGCQVYLQVGPFINE